MKARKLIVILATLAILATAAPAAVAASPESFKEAVSIANLEMKEEWQYENFFSTSLSGKPVNENTWNIGVTLRNDKTKVLVFGDPHGDIKNGYHRYLGYAKGDEDFSNVQFPIEVWGRSHIEDYDWIEQPWDNSSIKAAWGDFKPSYFDDVPGKQTLPQETREKFNHSIIVGLYYEFYEGKQIVGDGVWDIDWVKYVHVYQPPTKYSWGMGRMWNLGSDGGIYYKTVNMAPTSWNILVVTPDTHTMDVGDTYQYTATLNNSRDVTAQSTWSVSSTSIATINAGSATGVAPGSVTITATYTPPGEDSVSATATLIVNEKKPETPAIPTNPGSSDNPSGSNPASGGSGTLTFQAVNQATWNTSVQMYALDGKPAKKLTRTPGTAKWTDKVTATLSVPEPPQPQFGDGDEFLGFVDWEIVDATLTYPAMSKNFSFGNPVQPEGTKTVSLADSTNGPPQATATGSFIQDWSHDGYGVYNMLTKTHMAREPRNYTLYASYTVNYRYDYRHWVSPDPGDPADQGHWEYYYKVKGSTGPLTVPGELLVNGAGAAPVTSGNKLVIVSVND